ncbi:hypothetical protein EXS74_04075 [Candidatus Woesearchaeota archaeon]|nr:hypothetical protein [Candidatus Woesearchaeota archaeon]
MKIEVALVFTLVLSFTLVSANLLVPCSEDVQCDLSLGGKYSCVQRVCTEESVVSVPEVSGSLIPQTREISWSLLSLEENQHTESCTQNGCLSFAPVKQQNSLQKFIDFVLYLNV